MRTKRSLDLRWVAAASFVVLGTIAAAALVYELLDILLIVFLGIVVAAALQPWQVRLCRLGVPKGAAVLLLYLTFLAVIVLLVLIVAPVVIAQMTTFASELPATYASLRTRWLASGSGVLRVIAMRLPPFERLTTTAVEATPELYKSILGLTTSVLTVLAYVVTVLAVAFYWTMELPHLERMVLSFVPVARRADVLNVWHEIEAKLGAFIRGQAMAMVAVGVASAIGYALVGLPNVLALAVLAGMLEAVPMLGPTLAAIPAVLVALSLGTTQVLLVIGVAITIQALENNLLVPRIMEHAVGVSALVGLVAVLAFGTLYGILGVFIAIPITAVAQVLAEAMVLKREPVTLPQEDFGSPWVGLRTRLRTLREGARERLRARDTRMGIDPATTDHVIDAVDQQIEHAAERVEQIVETIRDAPLPPTEHAALVERLQGVTENIEQAVDRVDSIVAAADTAAPSETVALPLDELSEATAQVGEAVERVETVIAVTADAAAPIVAEERDAIVAGLDDAAKQIKDAVDDVDEMVAEAREKRRV